MKIEKRNDGFYINDEKIKFAHFRTVTDRGHVEPCGGATVAYIGDKETMKAAGVAYCSQVDNFQYAYGRQKAMGRLAQGLTHTLPGDSLEDVDAYVPKYITNEPREDVESAMAMFGFSRY